MILSDLSQWYWPAGMVIGFIAAAPVGPVNILVIQRCLRSGLRSALAVACGAIAADVLFASIAIFGLGALTSLWNTNQTALRLVGGIFMLLFAALLWRQAPHIDDNHKPPPPPLRMAIAIFLMSLTNAATLLWFLAAVASFRFNDIGHASHRALYHSGLILAGVAGGALLWWTLLSLITRRFRQLATDKHLRAMNHAVAVVLLLFGGLAIGSAL